MPTSLDTTIRTAHAQAIIDRAGSGAKLKLYSGTRPSGVSAVGGGNTLLATLTAASVIGSASSAGVDFNEGAFTQNAASHVTGTPTFADITTSSDVAVARTDLGGAGNWSFVGQVTNGQAVSLTNLSYPVGNA